MVLGVERANTLFSLLREKARNARRPLAWYTWALDQDPFRILSEEEIGKLHNKKRSSLARAVAEPMALGFLVADVLRDITSRPS